MNTDTETMAPVAEEPQPLPGQDPDPDSPKGRLIRLVQARASYLQQPIGNQPGLDPEASQKEALRQLGVNLSTASLRDSFTTYLKTGAKDSSVYDFAKWPDPSDPTNPAHYATLQQHSWLRDWIGEPLLRVPVAAAQGLTNLGAGVANLFGAGITPPEMESAAKAGIRKMFGAPESIKELRAEELAKQQAYEETRGLGQQIVQGAGTAAGAVLGFGYNPVLPAASALAKGSIAGKWIANAAAKIGASAETAAKIGALAESGAAGFGALQFLSERTGQQPLSMDQRAREALMGTITGPLYELTGQAGKSAFFALMRGAGRDGKALSDLVANYAKDTGLVPAENEANSMFMRRALDHWIDNGTPGLTGLGINARKAAAMGVQAMVEGGGFSAIDANFRKDLAAAWFDHDQDAWGRLAVDFASNALGMWFLHAGGRFADVVRGQRNVPTSPEKISRAGQPTETTVLPDNLGRLGFIETGRQEPSQTVRAPPGAPPQTPAEAARVAEIAAGKPQEAAAPRTFEIPGSPYSFTLEGDVARPSSVLRDALGSPETMPAADFLPKLEKASLVSALLSKHLPGQEVSVEGTHGDGDTLRLIRFGNLLEREASISSQWREVDNAPTRPAEEIQEPQKQAVQDLVNARKRPDLQPEDQVVLDAATSALSRVAAENDPSVREALAALPKLLPEIQQGNPETAGNAIKTLAELLTTKSADVVNAQQEAATTEQATPQPEPRPATRSAPGEVTTQAAEKPSAIQTSEPSVEQARPESTKVEQPTPEAAAEAIKEDEQKAPDTTAAHSLTAMGLPAELAIGAVLARPVWKYAVDPVLSAFSDSLIKRAERAKAPAPAIDTLNQANTASKELRTRYVAQGLNRYLASVKYTAGIPSRVLRELTQLLTHKDGSQTTLWAALQDEHLGNHFGVHDIKLSKEALEIANLAHDLIVEGAKIANENGIKFRNAEGGLSGNPDLYRLPRKLTEEGRAAYRDLSSVERRALVDYLTKLGYKPGEIEANLNEFSSLVRHDSTEYARFFKMLPSRIPGPKGSIQLYEDHPFHAIERIARDSYQILGARSVFDKLPKGELAVEGGTGNERPAQFADVPDGARQMLVDLAKTANPATVQAVKDAVRNLYGLPVFDSGRYDPPRSGIVRVLAAFVHALKANKLSVAALSHISQLTPWSPAAMFFGPKAWSEGLANTIGKLLSFKLPAERERLAEAGFLTREQSSGQLVGESGLETFENAVSGIASAVTAPLHGMISMIEATGAAAAESRLAAMQEGGGTTFDRSALTALDFRREQIDRMLAGDGTPEEYAQYRTGIVNRLLSMAGEMGVERPISSHTRTGNALLWFQGFFRKMTKQFRAFNDEYGAAKSNADRGIAAAKMATFVALSSLGAFSVQLAKKWFKTGEGLSDMLRELANDPVGLVRTVFTSALFGPLPETLVQGGKLLFEGGTKGQLVESAARFVPLVDTVTDAAMFAAAMVNEIPGMKGQAAGYEGLTALEKVGRYLTRVNPLVGDVKRGLFGIAALALTDRPPALQNALDAKFRWQQTQGPPTTPDPEDLSKIGWLNAMHSVIDQVERGQQWGDQALMQALEKADIFGATKSSIAESLRSKKTFRGEFDPKSPVFDETKYNSLRAYLGPKNTNVLEAFDDALEYLALSWRDTHR